MARLILKDTKIYFIPPTAYAASVSMGAVAWIATQQNCGWQAAHIFIQESSGYGITGSAGQP